MKKEVVSINCDWHPIIETHCVNDNWIMGPIFSTWVRSSRDARVNSGPWFCDVHSFIATLFGFDFGDICGDGLNYQLALLCPFLSIIGSDCFCTSIISVLRLLMFFTELINQILLYYHSFQLFIVEYWIEYKYINIF